MVLFYNLALLLLTILASRLIAQKNLFAAWLTPAGRRLREFGMGYLLMAVLAAATRLLLGLASGSHWAFNPGFGPGQLPGLLCFDLNSVLFEELVFRGLLLYVLVRCWSVAGGVLVSAIAFGIYHWFTQGVFGHPLGMLLVFLLTGSMGYVFATAYARTGSLVLPFGLHLGWNTVDHIVFSNGPAGPGLLQISDPPALTGGYIYFSFGLHLLVALGVWLWIRNRFTSPTHG